MKQKNTTGSVLGTQLYSLESDWNAFLVVYELKNFSLAAKRLGVTQSALSKSIRKLEEKLSLKLFDRSQRPVRPTDDAKVLHDGIFEKILNIERTITAVKSKNYDKPIFRFGCTEATCRYIVPAVAKHFSRHVSKFIQTTASSDTLIEKLIDRQLDVIFVCEAFEEIENLTRHFVFDEPSILILPKSLAKRKTSWTLEELLFCGLPMIASSATSGGGRLNRRFLSSRSLSFQSLFEVQSDSVMVEMIKDGLGWSLSRPSTMLANTEQAEKISLFPIRQTDNKLKYFVITRQNEWTEEGTAIARLCRQIYDKIIYPKFEEMAPWIAREH